LYGIRPYIREKCSRRDARVAGVITLSKDRYGEIYRGLMQRSAQPLAADAASLI
jgi:hypothetical protein